MLFETIKLVIDYCDDQINEEEFGRLLLKKIYVIFLERLNNPIYLFIHKEYCQILSLMASVYMLILLLTL